MLVYVGLIFPVIKLIALNKLILLKFQTLFTLHTSLHFYKHTIIITCLLIICMVDVPALVLLLHSGSSTGEGSCVFFGQRLERFCDSLTEYARNLVLKPLNKYSTSKSSIMLSSDGSHIQGPTGWYILLFTYMKNGSFNNYPFCFLLGCYCCTCIALVINRHM